MADHALTANQSGSVITARPGDAISVHLPEPGGGYRWQRTENGEAVAFDSDGYGAATGQGIGGSQMRMFLYRATSPGASLLRFELRREWEHDRAPRESCEFRVEIAP